MGEYGDPDKPDEWEYVKKISPYHNIANNTDGSHPYPSILFTTYVCEDYMFCQRVSRLCMFHAYAPFTINSLFVQLDARRPCPPGSRAQDGQAAAGKRLVIFERLCAWQLQVHVRCLIL